MAEVVPLNPRTKRTRRGALAGRLVLTDDWDAPEVDEEPDVHVSVASIWEVAIKQSRGRPAEPADLPEEIMSSGFRPLPITFAHAAAAGRLPPIHRDPFDRMLIAQARAESLTLVTHDPYILKYDVELLPV